MRGVSALGKVDYGALAQNIRNRAGVPDTQIVGPRYADALIGVDESVGLTQKDAFAAADGQTATVFAAQADSGSGTANDPYIIENKLFDSNVDGANQAINWTDDLGNDADSHMLVRNCKFVDYPTVGMLRCQALGSGSITFQNCTATGGLLFGFGATVINASVSITYDRCRCDELNGATYKTNNNTTSTLIITDCIITSATSSANTPTGIELNSTSGTDDVTIQYCRFDGTTNDMNYAIRPRRSTGTFNVYNNYFLSCGVAGSSGAIRAGGAFSGGPLVMKYCRFDKSLGEHAQFEIADGHEVSYCDFLEQASGKRGLVYNDTGTTNIDDIEVHHCYFSTPIKTQSTEENCFFIECSNVICHDNWANTTSEDAFEAVRPRTGGAQFYNLVGDNVGLQIVNVFQSHATAAGDDTMVHHIYGDCVTEGVALEDQQTGTVANVHVSTTDAAVALQDNAGTCDDCRIYGPITNNGGGLLAQDETAGTGNTISGVIGVTSI